MKNIIVWEWGDVERAEKGFPNRFCCTWQLMVFRALPWTNSLIFQLFYDVTKYFAWHRFCAAFCLFVCFFRLFCDVIRRTLWWPRRGFNFAAHFLFEGMSMMLVLWVLKRISISWTITPIIRTQSLHVQQKARISMRNDAIVLDRSWFFENQSK